MDDLAGRGFPGGSSAGSTMTGGRRRLDDRFDDVTAGEMTMIIPIDESDAAGLDWDVDHEPGSSRRTRRTTTSEITQDILIPEGEFDEYRHDEPFDVTGAAADDFDDADRGALSDEPAFRRNPASAPSRSRGKHRISAPPKALRGGRAAFVAMAAGAAVAAAVTHSEASDDAAPATSPIPAAATGDAAAGPAVTGPGIAPSTPDQDMSMYADQLVVGKQLAAAEAARVAAASKPLFASPLPLGSYQFTSTYAMRWGSFHAGVDFAAPLGTPIHAATDGEVIAAGPASGFGNWIKIKAADGTVTVYGHMYSNGVLVHKGQHVEAGDVIGLVGSDGQSTGPHCHFEVWLNGTTKIDPAPWLAAHGVRMSAYTG
ncbi:M23 family metallopeptidase [Gordonia sp. NPDC003950]